MDFSAILGLLTSGAGLRFGKSGKKSGDAWQRAAETYGLLHKRSGFWTGPKLSGPLSGNHLTVELKNRNTASAATRFRLRMPALDLGLKLRKKGFWNSLGPRTLTGDRAFDNQVVVDGRHRLAAQEFLTDQRRQAVQSFLGSFKGAVVADDEISVTTRGVVKNADDMLGTIDAMTLIANVLSEPAPSPSSVQAEPEPFEPVAAVAAVEATEHSEPIEPVEAEVEAPAPSGLRLPEENMPDVDDFCATVFAPGALSIIANQKFRESYQGARIAWTGTLESLTPYSYDFDFGAGRGVKAVLTIRDNEALGSRNIQAVIGLPPGIEGLDDKIGQPIAFAGRLLKVDGLAKRVVVVDAALHDQS